MINIFRSLLTPVKTTDDINKYNDLYKNTITTIQKMYKDTEDIITETISNMNQEYASIDKVIKRNPISLNKFSINPDRIPINTTKWKSLLDINNISKIDNDTDLDSYIRTTIGISYSNGGLIRNLFNSDSCILCTFDKPSIVTCIINKIIANTYDLRDSLYKINNDIIDVCKNIDSTSTANFIIRTAEISYSIYKEYCACYLNAFTEIISVFKEKEDMLTESVSDENVTAYVKELNEMIPKIRTYWNKFKYKDIIIPRKKTIHKMEDYMRGALDRKYTLKIPMYKVEGHIKDVQSVVNNFIKEVRSITNDYPNYIVMAPSFDDTDDDKFIYITLKEPFGDKEDRKDRVTQSKIKELNEAALSAEDKKDIPSSEYGLPEIRKYPMPDKTHVIKAIQFFYACKPKNKQELADNIERRILELGLVGKVVIDKNNKNSEYFSEWVTDKNATLEKNGDKYTVSYNDGKDVEDISFKPLSESTIEFIL